MANSNSSRSTESPEERERLILERMPQVRLIARRIHQHISGRLDLDDLVSHGVLGLINAIDCFDPARNIKLSTFAEWKIRGAILEYLRSLDGLPRDERRHVREIEQATARLRQLLHRDPTSDEIAAEAGLSLTTYNRVIAARNAFDSPCSLDWDFPAQTRSRHLTPHDLIAAPNPAADEELADSELKRAVVDALSQLSPKAARIITLHYIRGLTLRALAPILGMSEWQLQQAKNAALAELRRALVRLGVVPASAVPAPASLF